MKAKPMRPDYSPNSAYHKGRRHLLPAMRLALDQAIATFGKPASIIDFGCGEGEHLDDARRFGIKSIGVDLGIPKGFEADGMIHADLRVPLDLGISAEWILCLEVAEHLPEECAGILCETVAAHVSRPAGRLIFSAAPPGQRGDGHINCQPRAFWWAHFRARGLTPQLEETAALAEAWRQLGRAPWYARNATVFAWA